MLTTRTSDRGRLGVLRAALPHGDVIGADHPGWDAARRGYDTAADLRPAAVVDVRGRADIRTALMFARAQGLGVAVQCSGHGALAALDGAFSLQAAGLRSRATDARLARLAGELRGWTGRPFLNFAHRPPAQAFAPEVRERLARVQARFDPDGLIRMRHAS